MYKNPKHGFSYLIKMTYDCLDRKAQFRFLDSQLLHNIEKNGTLASLVVMYLALDKYPGRLVVYQGKSDLGKKAQKLAKHRLKQTARGSLFFYERRDRVCVEPNSSKYLIMKTFCDTTKQKFTFGKGDILLEDTVQLRYLGVRFRIWIKDRDRIRVRLGLGLD